MSLSSWVPAKSVAAKFLRYTQVVKSGLKGTTRRVAINLVKDQTPSAAGGSPVSFELILSRWRSLERPPF